MKMELIQPFINAADAVLAQNLQGATSMQDLTMEAHAYRRKGIAAVVDMQGEIEGRVIFDLEPATASQMASFIAGGETPEAAMVDEAVCELANQVIGNAVTTLNDQGFRFKVLPPHVHRSDEGLAGNVDTEALVLCFETVSGKVYLNIAMRHNLRRRQDGRR
jgi:CheY-specific phosphatase CheX